MADEKKLTLFSGHPSLKVLWILLSRRNALKEITRNINTLWSRYQPIDSKPNTLNQSNSFREHVLISINSNQPLILGKKIQKIQTHKTTVSNFVNTVEARIKDSPFCTVKRSVQIDAQTFWRLAKESGIEDYPKSSKNEEMLSDFYYKLFDFSKIGFRARESISIGRKIFKQMSSLGLGPWDNSSIAVQGKRFQCYLELGCDGRRKTFLIFSYTSQKTMALACPRSSALHLQNNYNQFRLKPSQLQDEHKKYLISYVDEFRQTHIKDAIGSLSEKFQKFSLK
ncbi:hypothetical protein PHYBLDRAFT_66555 [Phycomyces blakesleeanus NRRL 1555(-)]|uniref:Uncharacterized protein n=1 Tax=Phycomyces blakesleeanus (strain ATCC 8743b / DSM 1359 / FGSC 10004 / NBRC 33097 / NRRL 1555) TaxID=763407 RepID=A0A162TZQ9_PHYB8|nr:hypothetical protein PHYBLDRAFT_66555 [Phycomyces blakesleeanus NRRL 1555(-)]OAD71153.1 hypothetical protein PHYBLDRAFT_66555 [Phycomyces blakesleeanus NRRL 1555(-)]|eukprot:XP_018289193.1 hypothetical protein PHYBLDRAFT_66555 [Phycomyces blakesleeanus NRRL 1555(-)]